MNELTQLTIKQAQDALRNGNVTSEELTSAHIQRIEQVDPQVESYLRVTADAAMEQAKQADQRRKDGDESALLGIPLAYKDVLVTEGVETTCGSKILEGYIPPYTATAVAKLNDAGAVMLGKLNMDEFAMGSSTENSAYKTTRNPWDTERVPGGSSGGSAAAVAAGLALGTLGTDTGGSIRQPGALCGVVGLKPSYGRVSRYGLVAFGSSLDQIGPFTRTVEDAAIMLNVIAGHDAKDSTSMPVETPNFTTGLPDSLDGVKVGLPKEYFSGAGIQPEVLAAVNQAIEQMKILGAEMVEISLPHTEYAIPVYYLVATAEASANLARFEGVRYGPRIEGDQMWDMYNQTRGSLFGPEVKRRIMLGTYALSAGYYDAYYGKAQKVRTLIKQDFEQAFEKVDVIAGPVSPTTAFKFGEKMDDPLQMYLSDVFTIAVNLAGVPAMSVPCGFDSNDLPIGLHLIGAHFDEASIIKVGHAYQQATDFHQQVAPIDAG